MLYHKQRKRNKFFHGASNEAPFLLNLKHFKKLKNKNRKTPPQNPDFKDGRYKKTNPRPTITIHIYNNKKQKKEGMTLELPYLNELIFINDKNKLKRKIKFSDNEINLINIYLEKIKNTIQDLNGILNTKCLKRNDIICIFIYLEWLYDAQKEIYSKLQKFNRMEINKNKNFEKYETYTRVLRSFISAHPIGTNEHKGYIELKQCKCLDVFQNIEQLPSLYNSSKISKQKITLDGIVETDNLTEKILLKTVKNDTVIIMEVSETDIYNAALIYINRIIDLDKALYKTFKTKK